MAKILVVGGAGYVGGAACAHLQDQGHRVWVLDDLSTGNRPFLIAEGFTHARAGDRSVVRALLERERFDAVLHFAARSLVEESLRDPEGYRQSNVVETEALLETLLEAGVRKVVFSSSAAVYGAQDAELLDEDAPLRPTHPYGETKLAVEKHLAELARARGLQAIALRYFNAAGADERLRTGEWHRHETHLIPRILSAAIENRPVEIFGNDYATPDGTCVRDYVHVMDLARAHEAALDRLLSLSNEESGSFSVYNLGSGTGQSVLEILSAAESVLGRKLERRVLPRRPGDPPRLVAKIDRARAELGFFPRENALRSILETAWRWEQKRRERRRAIFVDRDGTLNADPGYIRSADGIVAYPFAAEALALLKEAGFLILVVSNQSGVARGIIPPGELPRIHDSLDLQLGPSARIDDYEFCMRMPDDPSSRRKPKPDLIHAQAARWNVDLSRSYMIGDRGSDVVAGCEAGVQASILVRTGDGENTLRDFPAEASRAAFVARDVLDAARWILERR